jgi:hypothetical protein
MNDAYVEVAVSKDGGHNWSNWRRRSLGLIGEYQQRIRLLRLGRYRQLVVKIRISSPVKSDLMGATVSIEPTDG